MTHKLKREIIRLFWADLPIMRISLRLCLTVAVIEQVIHDNALDKVYL